jgi:undecaprenyl diphosphate synthase
MAKKSDIDLSQMKIPNHVAIILDGNGRWAKKRLMPRNYGHMQGAKTVEKICEDAWNMGIHYLTVYAFSTENWKRPEDEVSALMKLLKNYLKDCIERSNSNDMRVRVIGDKTGLNDEIREKIAELEEMTKNNTGLNFTIAINYGSRDEMVRAMKKMAMDIKDGKVPEDDISEETFGNYLDTVGIPDPDLLIRTSGEQRLSNYLLWQLAYTEFYFTDVLWPDFSKKDLEDAVFAYNKRDRRFGKIDT